MILDALTSKNWRQRRQVIEALVQSGDQMLVQELLDVLKEHSSNLDLMNSTLQLLYLLQAPVIPGLIQLLDNPDPETRMYAALALGELNDPSSVPHLIQAIQDTNEKVRFNAIEALGKLRAPEAVESLLGVLREGDFFLSFPAVLALGEIGDRRAAQALMELFDNPDLTEAVVTALGNIGDEQAAAYITRWLESNAGEAEIAASALAHIGRRILAQKEEGSQGTKVPAAVVMGIGTAGRKKLLASIPQEPETELALKKRKPVSDLAFLLGWSLIWEGENHPQEAERAELIKALIRLLAFPAAQRTAIQALIEAGPQVVPALIAWLKEDLLGEADSQVEIAVAVIQILGKLAYPDQIPVLLQAVDSEDGELATLAAEAIQEICVRDPAGAQPYFQELLKRLNQPSTAIRQALTHATQSLSDSENLQEFIDLFKTQDPYQREMAIQLLAGLNKPSALPLILEALHDPSEAVRKAALEALPCFPGPESSAALSLAVNDTDPAIRASACRALARCEPKFALPLLHTALQDPDPWTRIYACRSLGGLAQAASLPYLRGLLQDPAPSVRVALAETLCKIGSPEATQMARQLLSDRETDVHQVVERILSCLSETQM